MPRKGNGVIVEGGDFILQSDSVWPKREKDPVKAGVKRCGRVEWN